jgi:hypothetical protein
VGNSVIAIAKTIVAYPKHSSAEKPINFVTNTATKVMATTLFVIIVRQLQL